MGAPTIGTAVTAGVRLAPQRIQPISAVGLAIRSGIGLTAPLAAAAEAAIAQYVEPNLRRYHATGRDVRLDTPLGQLATRGHACLERLAAGEDVYPDLDALENEVRVSLSAKKTIAEPTKAPYGRCRRPRLWSLGTRPELHLIRTGSR